MKVLIVIAAVVVVLALVIMFVFTSHQSALQDEADRATATAQQQQKQSEADSKANTQGTIGPIRVIDTPLYNRENAALGEKGSGPKSVITNAEIDVTPLNSTDNQ